MDKLIKRLVKISSFLDDINESELSSDIDKTASNVLKIVEAQYVGVQGYWIRNSRCWPNCYRIKRAKNPELSSQEVWQKCHSEYVESIKGDNSTWDKYAETDNKSLSKFAEAGLEDKVKEVLSIESSQFNDLLNKNIVSGLPLGVSIDEAINDGVSKYENAIVAQADNLIKVASKLEEMGYKKAAAELGDISAEIIKQAGLWDWMKGKMGLQTSSYKEIIKFLQGLASMAATKYNEAWQSAMYGSTTKQEVQNKFDQWAINNTNLIIDTVSQVANNIAGTLSSQSIDKGAKSVGQSAIRLLNQWVGQFAKAPSMNLLRGLQENIRNALAGIEQVAKQQYSPPTQQGVTQQGVTQQGTTQQGTTQQGTTQQGTTQQGAEGLAAKPQKVAPAALSLDGIKSFIANADKPTLSAIWSALVRANNVMRGGGTKSPKATVPAATPVSPGAVASSYNNRKIKISKNI